MARDSITRACEEASALRKKWGLSMRPARDLFFMAAENGVLVFRMSLDCHLSGAFIRNKREYSGTIIVNINGKSNHHQRFTLAHEIGHLRLHKDISGLVENVELEHLRLHKYEYGKGESIEPATTVSIEQEANNFAAELLTPLKEVKQICLDELGVAPDKITNRHVIELAGLFGVSHQSILWRLRILDGRPPEQIRKQIENEDWHDLWRKYDPEGFKDTQPQQDTITWQPQGVSDETAKIISRFPDRYRRMAFSAYEKGLITSGKLAEILDLPDKDVVKKELLPLLRPDLLEQHKELDLALKNAMAGNTDGQD
ncbi:MAG: ImmA/IrrE family metallo-endopeptidase [Phycisphaerae bacterium]|nr:ImmA/IrrE family metallo-endopeptidase [Phycisphaerae bacterium]